MLLLPQVGSLTSRFRCFRFFYVCTATSFPGLRLRRCGLHLVPPVCAVSCPGGAGRLRGPCRQRTEVVGETSGRHAGCHSLVKVCRPCSRVPCTRPRMTRPEGFYEETLGVRGPRDVCGVSKCRFSCRVYGTHSSVPLSPVETVFLFFLDSKVLIEKV